MAGRPLPLEGIMPSPCQSDRELGASCRDCTLPCDYYLFRGTLSHCKKVCVLVWQVGTGPHVCLNPFKCALLDMTGAWPLRPGSVSLHVGALLGTPAPFCLPLLMICGGVATTQRARVVGTAYSRLLRALGAGDPQLWE